MLHERRQDVEGGALLLLKLASKHNTGDCQHDSVRCAVANDCLVDDVSICDTGGEVQGLWFVLLQMVQFFDQLHDAPPLSRGDRQVFVFLACVVSHGELVLQH